MNALVDSQIKYSPFISMFHSLNLNNKINRLHERCLQIIYNDKTTSFEQLLEKKILSLYTKEILTLATEMYRLTNRLSFEIINEIFHLIEESHHNLRDRSQFTTPPIRSVYIGRESISFVGAKIWELIPSAIRQINSLPGF